MELTTIGALSAAACILATATVATAQQTHDESYHADYIYGAPETPSQAWMVTRGGRLYDNWYATQDMDEPENTHPAWPASNSRTGAVTNRCKSCHGWDYRGADGQYATGSYQTGIKGVMGYGGSADDLASLLQGGLHGFTDAMISQEQTAYLAAFLTGGLDDMNSVIDPGSGTVTGDADAGAGAYQTTCAACHGFDGRALDWGDADAPAYVGTEANANPWEVLHKIRNGHPGVEMISLQAFDLQASVDVLAYTRTLPEK